MGHTSLGERMKENYEKVSQTRLLRRTPVAIRLDGKAFHTVTKGFKKPFDNLLVSAMQYTMHKLCQEVQNCKFGYTQSDEITLILTDYDTLETEAWFDYEVQKLCSITASMTTLYFNQYFAKKANYYATYREQGKEFFNKTYGEEVDYDALVTQYQKIADKGAMFDARCFNIPKEEVANLIYWRQQDAIRNSIQMVGQANFSHAELQGKSCEDIKRILREEGRTPWEHYPIHLQRGTACYKEAYMDRSWWVVDNKMPVILGGDRDYVERHIEVQN